MLPCSSRSALSCLENLSSLGRSAGSHRESVICTQRFFSFASSLQGHRVIEYVYKTEQIE